jgi:serine/threonine-protein kinase HipA
MRCDPQLPLRSGAQQTAVGRKPFEAFTDCAPDRWGRTLIERREGRLARQEERAVRSLGEMDHLIGVRDDLRQGALRFRDGNGQLSGWRPPQGARPGRRRLHRDREVPERGPGHLERHGVGEGGPDLAAAARIVVPHTGLLNLAGRHVLVLDRFDRTPNGQRIGYVSAMTMLEASDGDQRSYLKIAEVIERTSDRATDDHLRNHGFLHQHDDVWRLSPAFDLNPNPDSAATRLHTAIDDSDDTASLALALEVAPHFRLTPDRAHTVLHEIAGAVSRWRDVAADHELAPTQISAMEPAFKALVTVAEV